MALNRLRNHFAANLNVPVDSKTLLNIAGIDRWHQRIDELRNQYGFTIAFKDGTYTCEKIDTTRIKRRVYPTQKCRKYIIQRDQNACVICGRQNGDLYALTGQVVKLHFDHILPHSSTSDHCDETNPDHWQLLCNRHNNMKRDNRDFFERGSIDYLALIQGASAKEQKKVLEWLQSKDQK